MCDNESVEGFRMSIFIVTKLTNDPSSTVKKFCSKIMSC